MKPTLITLFVGLLVGWMTANLVRPTLSSYHPAILPDVVSAAVLGREMKPNNQYELLVYPDHFALYDGSKFVALGSWENHKGLEQLIAKDNQ